MPSLVGALQCICITSPQHGNTPLTVQFQVEAALAVLARTERIQPGSTNNTQFAVYWAEDK